MLPAKELVFPHVVELAIPGFLKQRRQGCYAQLPAVGTTENLFAAFVTRAEEAIGRHFFPICRLSDGEFLLLFGPRIMPFSILIKHPVRSLRTYVKQSLESIFCGFHAHTSPGVQSGSYTTAEIARLRREATLDFQWLGRHGCLALHLEFGPTPFQENYFTSLRRWISTGGLTMTNDNCLPFYFVYAMLMGPEKRRILNGRRVIVIHSATGEKQQRICRALSDQGVSAIHWIPISRGRSFFDRLDLSRVQAGVDVCLVGAGIGKARILKQLQSLNTLCIDAGYCFEVWADPDRRWYRPYMVDDSEFDEERILF
jgi:hypothetical protein